MWFQFISQNVHFGINVFIALVLAAICWLYFDAWTAHREKKELLKWTGFGVLSLSFFVQATVIEQEVLAQSAIQAAPAVSVFLRVIGYVLLIAGLVLSPLQQRPDNKGLDLPSGKKAAPRPKATASPAFFGIGTFGDVVLAAGGFAVAALYWRMATTGLERHFKRLAIGFLAIGISDLIAIAASLRDTQDPVLYGVVAAFGWVWWLEHLVLLAGGVLLCIWVWSYLTKRFFSQLFMVFTLTAVLIFFIVSVSLTALLMRSVWVDAQTNLRTAANVLVYALQARQADTASGAEQVAANPSVVQAVATGDHGALVSLTENYLVQKQHSSLMITAADGKVLLRAEDPSRWGDSVSSDPLLRRALLGKTVQTIARVEQLSAPGLFVKSATPVRNEAGIIVGVAITGVKLDAAFVDGIKKQTGLQSTIYAGDTVAATTLLAADGKTRSTGFSVNDQAVSQRVLRDAKSYEGAFSFQNRQFLSAFTPLKDAENGVVGMIMISQPQNAALKSAGEAIEINFLATTILIIVSILPIYAVSRMIERQLE